MRRVACILLFFLVFGSLLNRGTAQSDSLNTFRQPKLLIGISLPHTLLHGVKLEALVPLGEKLYLYASPEVYSGRLTYQEKGNLTGLGLHAGLRYAYWQNERKGDGVMAFIQSEMEYNHFRIAKRDLYWVEKEVNGQKVIVQEEGDVLKRFNRLGINYKMGGLWYFDSGFYYEWSFGVALRRTLTNHTENYYPAYKNDNFPWSYGYSGIAPLLGLRFGFLIR